MAVRTTAAGNLDTTWGTLETQLATYLALQQTGVPGDNPALYFWLMVVQRLRDLDAGLAQVIDTAPKIDPAARALTLVEIDGLA